MGFEAMVEFDDEGMVQHRHYSFLILYDILFLVFAYESFQHHLHGVELPISETSHQVDLTKPSDGEAFADFISFESAFWEVF